MHHVIFSAILLFYRTSLPLFFLSVHNYILSSICSKENLAKFHFERRFMNNRAFSIILLLAAMLLVGKAITRKGKEIPLKNFTMIGDTIRDGERTLTRDDVRKLVFEEQQHAD